MTKNYDINAEDYQKIKQFAKTYEKKGIRVWGKHWLPNKDFEGNLVDMAIDIADMRIRHGKTTMIKPKEVLIELIRLFYKGEPRTERQKIIYQETGELPEPTRSMYMEIQLALRGRLEE
jgi:hypothetical protein